jgi:hypothetical protein
MPDGYAVRLKLFLVAQDSDYPCRWNLEEEMLGYPLFYFFICYFICLFFIFYIFYFLIFLFAYFFPLFLFSPLTACAPHLLSNSFVLILIFRYVSKIQYVSATCRLSLQQEMRLFGLIDKSGMKLFISFFSFYLLLFIVSF